MPGERTMKILDSDKVCKKCRWMANGHLSMCCNKKSGRYGENVANDDRCVEWEMPENDDLMPCPFCGSSNVKFNDMVLCGFSIDAFIFCEECGANMTVMGSRRECLNMWNRRPKVDG